MSFFLFFKRQLPDSLKLQIRLTWRFSWAALLSRHIPREEDEWMELSPWHRLLKTVKEAHDEGPGGAREMPRSGQKSSDMTIQPFLLWSSWLEREPATLMACPIKTQHPDKVTGTGLAVGQTQAARMRESFLDAGISSDPSSALVFHLDLGFIAKCSRPRTSVLVARRCSNLTCLVLPPSW